MRGWGLWLVVTAIGCARAADADNLPPPTLGPPSDPTEDGDDGEDSDSSGSSEGPAADETAAPESSGEEGSDDAASTDDGSADDTTGTPAACEPQPDDTECFQCGREACCIQLTACDADPVCRCAVECIRQGGESDPCVADCGGQNEQTINLLGCVYFQCDGLC